MTRLTNDVKNKIWNNIYNKTLKPKVEDNENRQKDLALRMLYSVVGKDNMTLAEGMRADGDVLFTCKIKYFRANLRGRGYTLLNLKDTVVVPASLHPDINKAWTCDDVDLNDEYDQLQNQRRDLTREVSSKRYQLSQTLKEFSTVKKLITAWPEIKECIPDEVLSPAKKQEMVLNRSELNNKFGLPTGQA